MDTLIIGLAIFSSALLVLTVLAQNPKGGGLSSQFGGSGASNFMGVKKTGDILERLTWGFFIALLLLSLSSRFTISSGNTDDADHVIERASEQQGGLPTTPKLDLTPTSQKGDTTAR